MLAVPGVIELNPLVCKIGLWPAKTRKPQRMWTLCGLYVGIVRQQRVSARAALSASLPGFPIVCEAVAFRVKLLAVRSRKRFDH